MCSLNANFYVYVHEDLHEIHLLNVNGITLHPLSVSKLLVTGDILFAESESCRLSIAFATKSQKYPEIYQLIINLSDATERIFLKVMY